MTAIVAMALGLEPIPERSAFMTPSLFDNQQQSSAANAPHINSTAGPEGEQVGSLLNAVGMKYAL